MSTPDPVDTRADVLLREALSLLAPLVRLLVANGVPYPVFAQSLKSVFLAAAQAELASEDKRITDSALSLLSGVHRKDVRAMTGDSGPSRLPKAASMASEVCGRWRYDPAWQDELGLPRPLPVRSNDDSVPTFEKLAQSVSKDFHARSVLEELLRLGVAEQRGDTVLLRAEEFIPSSGFAETATYASANVHDHLSAMALNLGAIAAGKQPPYIEHAVAADELSAESAQRLHQLARTLWAAAVRKTVRAATEAVEADRALPPEERGHRFRFGAYDFHGPDLSLQTQRESPAQDTKDAKDES